MEIKPDIVEAKYNGESVLIKLEYKVSLDCNWYYNGKYKMYGNYAHIKDMLEAGKKIYSEPPHINISRMSRTCLLVDTMAWTWWILWEREDQNKVEFSDNTRVALTTKRDAILEILKGQWATVLIRHGIKPNTEKVVINTLIHESLQSIGATPCLSWNSGLCPDGISSLQGLEF